jgi:hypothetical protein
MFKNAIHGVLCAIDHVDHTFREANLLDELENELHGHWHFFRRLHDVGVARCERVWQIPEGNHAWEVERRDGGAHAHRLTDHDLVNAGGNVFHKFAFAHVGHTAGNFDIFVGANHFGFGFFKGLACFVGDELRYFIAILAHEISQLEQILHAVIDRHAPP